MRLVLLLVTGILVAVAAFVWRSRNGAEVWHTLGEQPS